MMIRYFFYHFRSTCFNTYEDVHRRVDLAFAGHSLAELRL